MQRRVLKIIISVDICTVFDKYLGNFVMSYKTEKYAEMNRIDKYCHRWWNSSLMILVLHPPEFSYIFTHEYFQLICIKFKLVAKYMWRGDPCNINYGKSPCFAAPNNGVSFKILMAFTFAPALINASTAFTLPNMLK